MAKDKIRIIAFGAHPDDCEYVAAGTAARWAARGHAVKFVACTNGDIGHFAMAGGPLARRRTAEVRSCAKILGITAEVLDNHDGELLPTLENRKRICTLIRQWNADVVIGHRPNDYHPDHRYTGVLVQDAAYMVTVPFFCPDIPHLTKNPVFLYSEDRFLKPNPFSPDIAVAIDETIEKKLNCFEALESQFYEGGCNATARTVPRDAKLQAARRKKLRAEFRSQFAGKAGKFRMALEDRYGRAAGQVGYAEAFEICEYGAQPDEAEIRRLFPFFPGM
jgi:LmbE family N-acetylglucosaminyl deacetylase